MHRVQCRFMSIARNVSDGPVAQPRSGSTSLPAQQGYATGGGGGGGSGGGSRRLIGALSVEDRAQFRERFLDDLRRR